MKKHGILNSEISKVLADLGHTDQITIGDCGLPVPSNVKKIDVSLSQGFPKFIEVLKVVLEDMKIEKVILAEEIKKENANQLEAIKLLLEDDVEIEFVSHEDFKQQTQESKAVIRTGEITPYSNIILQSNVTF
ncbi:D-ribose pyranase [Globicatella sp. HMSC072A10]|uniref:D-ribose pyranase n=1 Tax=Globicatella sp. HMSC072A10 TaxID=1739315 RepID=UPI0008C895F4|nr:D-ribose pyranase [Globicatella sp. HMSC072A10]OFK58859.1 D-ribose pyranase [Globicatella sp. HMSC072A10]